MDDRATFSVAIPCYNYARFLERCVGSVLEQRDVRVDVLIIDDCSTDDSEAVGRRLAEDPRVTYRRHEANEGHIATFNEGVDWAANDFFLLLSADDLVAPGAFARAATVFERHPGVGLVYGGVERFVDTVEPADVGDPDSVTVHDGREWVERRCRAAENCVHSPEVILRTAVQRQAGHYDLRCRHTSDLNMWLRVGMLADLAYLDGSIQAYYRRHDSNMSRVEHGRKLGQIQQRHMAFQGFFEDASPHAPVDRWRQLEGRRIAAETIWEVGRAIERNEANDDDVAAHVEFAVAVDPSVRRRPGFIGMTIRRRLGSRSRFLPPFLASRLIRAGIRKWEWRNRMRNGS